MQSITACCYEVQYFFRNVAHPLKNIPSELLHRHELVTLFRLTSIKQLSCTVHAARFYRTRKRVTFATMINFYFIARPYAVRTSKFNI